MQMTKYIYKNTSSNVSLQRENVMFATVMAMTNVMVFAVVIVLRNMLAMDVLVANISQY